MNLDVETLKTEFLQCGICMNEYDESYHIPRVLPCLHVYCEECMSKVLLEDKITCPACRFVHDIHGGDVRKLQKENTIRSLRDFVCVNQRRNDIKCYDCPNKGKAESFCVDCAFFLCEICLVHHKRFLGNHSTITMAELQSSAEAKTFQRVPTCEIEGHERQKLKYFCKTCQVPICLECTVCEHQNTEGHKRCSVSEVYEEQRKALRDSVMNLDTKRVATINVTKALSAAENKLMTEKQRVVTKITQEIDCLHGLLEQRKKTLLDSLNSWEIEKSQKLTKELDLTKQHSKSLDELRNFANHIIDNSNQVEFLQILTTIKDRIAELERVSIHDKPIQEHEVAADFDNEKDAIVDLCHRIGCISMRSTSNLKISAQTTSVLAGKMDVVCTFQVVNKEEQNIMGWTNYIEIYLTDPHGTKKGPLQVEELDDGSYCIRAMVTQVGVHDVRIFVMGTELDEKPTFLVYPDLRQCLIQSYAVKAKIRCKVFSMQISESWGPVLVENLTVQTTDSQHQELGLTVEKYYRNGLLELWMTFDKEDDYYLHMTLQHDSSTGILEKFHVFHENSAVFESVICPYFKINAATLNVDQDRNVSIDGFKLQFGSPATPSKEALKVYGGALGSLSFNSDVTGHLFYEVQVQYTPLVLHEEYLVFEIGLGRRESIDDSHHCLSGTKDCLSIHAAACQEHKAFCLFVAFSCDFHLHSQIAPFELGATVYKRYGLFLNFKKGFCVVIDLEDNNQVCRVREINMSGDIWPTFGIYNPHKVDVRMVLKCGSLIQNVPEFIGDGSD
ncbi:hypothetical protein CHS0354_042501 [Potamilus streckersoni]|uniref:Uncharacterized protein n=1 Tax=Potamilus streckersoni TaxID=2493646 RepID=A0AAE0S9B3_9BIVA|nr:hypothetical protein CHS0354_042501 [Potamilus streckersoni]